MGALTGSNQANAVNEAGTIQELASLKAARELEGGFGAARENITTGFGQGADTLSQFNPLIEQGLEGLSLLTNRQAQTDFVQNDPMTQAAIDNASRGIRASQAATGGSLSGDELLALTQSAGNIGNQALANQQNIFSNLLNSGMSLAGQQAGNQIGFGQNLAGLNTNESQLLADNLINTGDIRATSLIGQENARTAGLNNLLNTGLTLAGTIAGGPVGGSIASALTK